MKKILFITLLPCILNSCSTYILPVLFGMPDPVIDHSTIAATQLKNSPMPDQIPPNVLPNSGSTNIPTIVDGKYVLVLSSKPSTGYRWEKTYTEPSKGCLEFLKENLEYDYIENFSEGQRLVGAAGKQEWLIQPHCAGIHRITFSYKRPWEQGPPKLQTIAILNVTKP
jgi:predicted secreted protein